MSIDTTEMAERNEVVIRVSGRLDFSRNTEFRAAYEGTAGEGTHYVLDLTGAQYLDSSALGMLLVFRNFAGGDSADIEIRVKDPNVRRILEIANFQELFQIP
ncbi:MAG TPA: anti-sigma factor antagonist [Planctomycetes bacterium]|nr:anti-sigma factor antagonist [Planctomycetota bacterium]